jgi:riboflavin synthase
VFTGLIQGLGSIQTTTSDRLLIKTDAPLILTDLAIGDSVAVDGICLTVETLLKDGFTATASPETLNRTTLHQYQQNQADYVNLETSLRVGSKLGGHFVSGHVDGVGCLVESLPTEKAWEMIFSAPANLEDQWQQFIARYLVQKGSIAVNGISLTVAECDAQGTWFKAAVIPHTYSETNLTYLKPGDWVNLECDILGKYVEKLLNYPHASNSSITLEFLAEHGYS